MPPILGLDVGDARIGVAVSDAEGRMAFGLDTIQRKDVVLDLRSIARLVREYAADRVIVGLPIKMNKEDSPQTVKVRTLAALLDRQLPVPVELIDERCTTAEAERVLAERNVPVRKRKMLVDRVAAEMILQSYLDRHRPPEKAPSKKEKAQ